MKMNGKPLNKEAHIRHIVIPRQEGDILFVARGVYDFTPFDSIFKMPEPPVVVLKGGVKKKETDNSQYLAELTEYSEIKKAWLIMESLKSSPNIEWETVTYDNPETWRNCLSELEEYFNPAEVTAIQEAVFIVCGFSTELIQQATSDFLAGQGALPVNCSYQDLEQVSTLSLNPAND